MISTAMLCRIELANGGLHTKVEYWVGIVLHYRRAGSAHALQAWNRYFQKTQVTEITSLRTQRAQKLHLQAAELKDCIPRGAFPQQSACVCHIKAPNAGNQGSSAIDAPCLPTAELMGCFPAASGVWMVRAGAWILMLMLFCWMTWVFSMRGYPPW